MVLVIGPDPDRHAEKPAIRERFRPERVDLEPRRLYPIRLRFGLVLKRTLPQTECEDTDGERGPKGESASMLLDHGQTSLCRLPSAGPRMQRTSVVRCWRFGSVATMDGASRVVSR